MLTTLLIPQLWDLLLMLDLRNFMLPECLDSRFVFDRPLPVSQLVCLIGSKTQIPMQIYGQRPCGVQLLIAGDDDMGPHIFPTCPSVNYFDCRAMSIGALLRDICLSLWSAI